ncbi:MAG TPA: hypothetical protein VK901_01525, partial [Nitrospiraceae bacterium]|nr:hypothetical protein [Nitrospiraceae bacterium]
PDGSFMPHAECPMSLVVTGEVTEVRNGEVIIERPDGSRITVIVNIRQLKGPNGVWIQPIDATDCRYRSAGVS